LSINISAQERYKWNSVEEIKFYDLSKFDCTLIKSAEEIPDDSKSITYDKPIWESILPNQSNAPKDIITENSCYVIVVKFKHLEEIPFLLFPNQKALFDMRVGKFHFIILKNNVYKKFDNALKLSIDCLN